MVSRRNAGRPLTGATPHFEEEVLLHVQSNPATSTRAIATQLGDHRTLWTVLREQLLHLFHPMGSGEYPTRLEILQWFLGQPNKGPLFAE
ncbi:hypothetical protein PR048_001862 [Dryococelus australis]|uniref:Uncharacterized protein n=1 Tax=Dryococelus australis TaxID=614101 RepID=A0ABQ9IIJ3_9NEOP|nr:hypothetical protein PR048_001862 [Dryococelus australis]